MATAFSKLKRAGFNGIEFPVRHYTVKGSLRHHVHEYPHAWGGAFENLQRKLYEIRMTAPMMARFARYPDLWPTKWATLRTQFEQGNAGSLVIPTIGTIQARCIEWPETFDAKIQSGIMAELTFIEDQSQLFLTEKLVQVDKQRLSDMTAAASKEWQDAVNKYKNGVSKYEMGLIDSLLSLAGDILAIKDNVELYGALIESKVRAFDTLLREADAAVRAFDDPGNWTLVNAMRDLWQSIQTLGNDLGGGGGGGLQTWTVPAVMTIADVSTALYGNNSMAVTLLQSNAIDDAMAIPAGTVIKYLAEVSA